MADGAVAARPVLGRGQKLGYQDAGSWTLFKSTPVDRRKAAWLYAQFVVSKTVDVKKSHVGLTFIRDSTVRHESFTERAPKLGGLVEFYRSPDRVNWTPTGVNVPDYPKLAQLWWQQIGDVNSGAFTPQEAMDRLAGEMDQVMARMQAADEQANTYGGCGPRLNEEQDAGGVARQRRRQGQARKREAAGRDRRLRRTRQALGEQRLLPRPAGLPAHPGGVRRAGGRPFIRRPPHLRGADRSPRGPINGALVFGGARSFPTRTAGWNGPHDARTGRRQKRVGAETHIHPTDR